MTQKVEVLVLETHHGGQYDSTNIFRRPTATAVSSLGMDHVAQLGPTISDIAWHKSGIFKEGVPALTVRQADESAQVMLGQRADDVHAPLTIVEPDPSLPASHPIIQPAVQKLNFSLAKALVQHAVGNQPGGGITTQDVAYALDHVYLPGRFQTIADTQSTRLTWFLDGAHNEMSIVHAADWFMGQVRQRRGDGGSKPLRVVLCFSQISMERDGEDVLRALVAAIKVYTDVVIDRVVFCHDGRRADGSVKTGERATCTMRSERGED